MKRVFVTQAAECAHNKKTGLKTKEMPKSNEPTAMVLEVVTVPRGSPTIGLLRHYQSERVDLRNLDAAASSG